MSESVLLSIDGAIATITLNRPDIGNALDLDAARNLFQAAQRCSRDEAIRCVVLKGAGRLFCAGGDISSMQRAGSHIGPHLAELAAAVHLAVMEFARMSKPLICSVGGSAAGAGLSLAMLGDLVIAAESAHFTIAYTAVGLTPDGGASWLLPRLVGLRRAQELIITNRRVSAAEAAELGMITRVVASERLEEETSKLATQLAQSATAAIGAIRSLLLGSYGSDLEAHLESEAESIAAAGAGAEGREGIGAFLEKRKPIFAASPGGSR